MTNQTTYRQKMRNDEEEIDLVQMMRYILQKWKILLLAGAVGLLLGGAFGAIKTGKQPAQMDIDDLNIDQIQQYVSYHQFYEDEMTRQAESIYMNMNPEAVYMANKNYYVAAQESSHGHLVGSVEGAGHSAAGGNSVEGKTEQTELLHIRALERQATVLLKPEGLLACGETLGIAQRIAYGQVHIGHAELRLDRTIGILHHRVDYRLGMHHHLDFRRRTAE